MRSSPGSVSIARPLALIVHEPDEQTLRVIQASSAHHVVEYVDTEDAFAVALATRGQDFDVCVVGLPASIPTARAMLERLAEIPERPPILALWGLLDEARLLSLLRRGADDLLVKPFDAAAFRVRLRVVARMPVRRNEVGPPDEILQRAAASRRSGEVIVKSRNGTARVLLADGDIAWVHCPWAPLRLHQMLSEAGSSLDDATADAIREEALRSGRGLHEVVVAWGLADESRFYDVLRAELVRALQDVRRQPQSLAMFVEASWRRTASFGAIAAPSAGDSIPPPADGGTPAAGLLRPEVLLRTDVLCRALARMRGVESVAAFDLVTKAVTRRHGPAPDAAFVWSLLPLVQSAEARSDAVSEVFVTRGEVLSCAWRYRADPVALFAQFSLATTNIGLVVASMRTAMSELG